jgi:hypothetical protein
MNIARSRHAAQRRNASAGSWPNRTSAAATSTASLLHASALTRAPIASSTPFARSRAAWNAKCAIERIGGERDVAAPQRDDGLDATRTQGTIRAADAFGESVLRGLRQCQRPRVVAREFTPFGAHEPRRGFDPRCAKCLGAVDHVVELAQSRRGRSALHRNSALVVELGLLMTETQTPEPRAECVRDFARAVESPLRRFEFAFGRGEVAGCVVMHQRECGSA